MSKVLDVYNDFFKYRTSYGLQGLWSDGVKGGPEDNGTFFALDYMLILASQPQGKGCPVVISESYRLSAVLEELELGDTGMLMRRPGNTEVNSMDNVQAELVFGALFGRGKIVDQAKRMMDFAEGNECLGPSQKEDFVKNRQFYHIAWLLNLLREPKYFWNIDDPKRFGFRSWFGRSPGFLAFVRYRKTGKLGFLGGLSLWVGQFLGCFASNGNADARRLPYSVWQVLKDEGRFWNWSYRLWCFILMCQYENGMQTVNGIYYKDPLHPVHTHQTKYIPANMRLAWKI